MRLVILTSSRHGTASECIPLLSESASCTIAQVIICGGLPGSRARRLRQKLQKTLRIGLLGALNGMRMRHWYASPGSADVGEICERLGIPVVVTDVMGSEHMVALMIEARADLGLSLGNSYIPQRIFDIPRHGMINVHGERLPEYQNAQSVIWPIYNMETTTGISVHQIDRGIDTGAILYKEEFPIVFCERLEDTVRTTLARSRERLPAAVRHVCENFERLKREAVAQAQGRRYTTPTIWQFLRMQKNNRILFNRRKAAPRRAEQ